jgi:hypothetical protein
MLMMWMSWASLGLAAGKTDTGPAFIVVGDALKIPSNQDNSPNKAFMAMCF